MSDDTINHGTDLPQEDASPGPRDHEEYIEVHRVDIAQLRQLMTSGDMLLPSLATCFLALERLAALQHL